MTDRVVHFKVPFSDGDRQELLQADFGWQLNEIPEMRYPIVSTWPAAETGMPAQTGYVGGGMFEREPPFPQGPVITIDVDSIDDALEKPGRWAASPSARQSPVGEMDSPLTSRTPRATSWACGRPVHTRLVARLV